MVDSEDDVELLRMFSNTAVHDGDAGLFFRVFFRERDSSRLTSLNVTAASCCRDADAYLSVSASEVEDGVGVFHRRVLYEDAAVSTASGENTRCSCGT